MSVVVDLRGGLGNQLFQYAAGYAVSQRLGTDLVLDVALLPGSTVQRGGVRRWPEQISSFAHAGTIVDSAAGGQRRRRFRQARGTTERLIGDSRFAALLGRRLYAREIREDTNALRAVTGNVRINAYCNSPLFFTEVAQEVSLHVNSPVAPSEWFQRQLKRVRDEHPIALHVRWGDYLNLKHVFGETPAGYYRRAVDVLRGLTGSTSPLWLFSDDSSGASEYLAGVLELDHVVESPAESTPLENLLLLSGASGIVAANSSFSWWAAFLAQRTIGEVIFPRPLFGPAGPPEPKDWLLEDWIQIGRS